MEDEITLTGDSESLSFQLILQIWTSSIPKALVKDGYFLGPISAPAL